MVLESPGNPYQWMLFNLKCFHFEIKKLTVFIMLNSDQKNAENTSEGYSQYPKKIIAHTKHANEIYRRPKKKLENTKSPRFGRIFLESRIFLGFYHKKWAIDPGKIPCNTPSQEQI